MNILNVFSNPSGDGGSERSMHLSTAGLRDAGHRVLMVHDAAATNDWAPHYDGLLQSKQLFDRRAIIPPSGLAEAERQLDAFIADQQIDLLHVQSWPRPEVLGRLAVKHVVVSTTHVALCPNNSRYHWTDRTACDRDIGLGCFTTGYRCKGCGHLGNGVKVTAPGFIRSMVEDRRLRNAIAKSSKVISPSEWLKSRLIKDGMPEEKLRVLPPPMESIGVRREAPGDDRPVVLYVGRLVSFKGIDLVLHASARITTPHRVWIVGDGPMREELVALSRELKIADRVHFHGRLGPSAVNELRMVSRLAVVPSLGPENFAMVGAEAMLAGLPVVAFEVGGNAEWLHDSDSGFLVPPGDIGRLSQAMRTLLADREAAARMGRSGRQIANRLTTQRHVVGLIQIYDEAIGQAFSAR